MALTGKLGGTGAVAGRMEGVSTPIRIQIGASRGLSAQVSPQQPMTGHVGGTVGLVGIIARPSLIPGTVIVGSFVPVWRRCVFGAEVPALVGGFRPGYAAAVLGEAAESIVGVYATEEVT